MPLLKKIKENNCQIAIWDMSESIDELEKEYRILGVEKFRTEERKKEIICTRLLLNKLLPYTSISYNKFGAPEIEDNNFISISHSKNIVAIILSKKKIGLDIEKISAKPMALSSKFISKDYHTPLTKEKATLIWCCKEAVFKWHQMGGVNFIKDIRIKPFIIKKEGSVIAEFKKQKLTLHYKKIDTHFLVYVCK